MPSTWLRFSFGLFASIALASPLPAQVMQADGTGAAEGGVEMASYTSSGSYFNRELGTPLRFSYHSEGYGTDLGVVSLGSMKVFNLDGATWFLDGQGTMSDDFGGGFNAGIGYRELVNMSHGVDPDRVMGASFWTDGQSTRSDNFFTQLGFGLESLGESFDLRMNGYFPLDRTKDSDPELIDVDTVTFSENRLFAGLERITTDTAHSVIDAEAAKRIGNLDAWALAGVYQIGGGGADDTGYRIGVRGYAVPDLMVGVQVTDDDIYETNVMATLTWFVGRTHKGNSPVGTIVDRFREPVMRNDYITTTSTFRTQGAGGALTDADTDELFNFIHVDSSAAAGGDGTFENPFNNLAEAETAQVENAYVFVHGGSVLAATQTFTMQDNVKFWGEGINEFGDVVDHVVDSVERGTLTLPETAPGAQALASPTINVGAGVTDFLVLGDDSNINNFEINGGQNIIVANSANANVNADEAAEELANAATNGINAPELANLDINNPTGTAIDFTQITGTAVVDNTVTITGAQTGIDINGGNTGMNINARITNSVGTSLLIENRTGGTISYGGSIQDDNVVAATAEAIIIRGSTGTSAVNFTQVIDTTEDPDLGIDINSGNFSSLLIDNNVETTTITFADLRATAANADTIAFTDGGTLTINDSDDESFIRNTGTGDAFNNVGSATEDSTITIAANITNEGGGNAVDISARTANNATFNGTITDTNSNGISLTGNSGGTIAFNEQVTTTTNAAGNGVTITGGSDATYAFTDIDITTNTGIGFNMTHGGTLTVVPSSGEENTITTTSGQALVLDGTAAAVGDALTIGAGGVNFDEVNVSAGTTNSIVLREVEGTGQVRVGPTTGDPGDGGTIVTSGTAITIDNANNVAVNDVTINKTGAGQAVIIQDQDGGTVAFTEVTINADTTGNGLVIGTAAANEENTDGTASFTDLVVTTVDGDAVSVIENDGGTYIFNNLETDATGTGDGVVIANNSTDTTVTFNGMDVTTTSGTGFSASSPVGSNTVVAATGTNTVTTTTGTAVNLDTIATNASGITFTSVTKSAVGANSGVIVDTVTGGNVVIGSTGTASAINSTGNAIEVTDSTNVTVTNINVTGAGGNGLVATHSNDVAFTINIDDLTVAATKTGGIVSTHTGGGVFVLDIDDTDANPDILAASSFSHTGTGSYTVNINNADFRDTVTMDLNGAGTADITADAGSYVTTGGDIAFDMNLGTALTLANIRIRNNTITSENEVAFDFDSSSSNPKTVNFLFNQNIVSNNSASATADFDANQATLLNATVTNNNFSNAGAGDEMAMSTNQANTVINLNLNNNTASAGAGDIRLDATVGDFNIQDLSDVAANNPDANIIFVPNMAAFDDINSVPTPP
jgi:hypothetical protein